MKKLKTLKEHDQEAHDAYRKLQTYPKPNGIACPSCGVELMDSDSALLMSSPPQRRIHCVGCDYTGYRVA